MIMVRIRRQPMQFNDHITGKAWHQVKCVMLFLLTRPNQTIQFDWNKTFLLKSVSCHQPGAALDRLMTAYCSHRILSKSKILASARQRLLWINLVVNISFLLTTPETGGFEPMTPGTGTNKIHKIFFNKIRTIAFLEK